MDGLRNRFPHLDHFLNAYMHQDWRLFGDSIEDVVAAYIHDVSPEDTGHLRSEILDFISFEGNQIEPDYYRLYPNSVLPSGWGMTVKQWLNTIADAAIKAA